MFCLFIFYVHMFSPLFRLFFLVSSSKVLLDNVVQMLIFFHILRAMVVSFSFFLFSLPLCSSVNGKFLHTVCGHINNYSVALLRLPSGKKTRLAKGLAQVSGTRVLAELGAS